MKRKSQYTDEMIDFLVTNLEKYSWVELTKRFNLNFNCNNGEDAIRKFCSRNEKYFKNKRRKKILLTEFTKEMEDFLRANFKDISQEELTRRFNNKFNLKKEVYDIRYYCLKYGLRKNNPYTTPIGFEMTWPCMSKKYVFVKVDRGRWKAKHRLLWEQNNGPIPKGHCVIFADGNIYNFNSENLILVTAREHLFMKKSGLLGINNELTKLTISIAKIKIKIKDYNKQKEL